jgi:hypothetical protein
LIILKLIHSKCTYRHHNHHSYQSRYRQWFNNGRTKQNDNKVANAATIPDKRALGPAERLTKVCIIGQPPIPKKNHLKY